jgi:hypothetical protein
MSGSKTGLPLAPCTYIGFTSLFVVCQTGLHLAPCTYIGFIFFLCLLFVKMNSLLLFEPTLASLLCLLFVKLDSLLLLVPTLALLLCLLFVKLDSLSQRGGLFLSGSLLDHPPPSRPLPLTPFPNWGKKRVQLECLRAWGRGGTPSNYVKLRKKAFREYPASESKG